MCSTDIQRKISIYIHPNIIITGEVKFDWMFFSIRSYYLSIVCQAEFKFQLCTKSIIVIAGATCRCCFIKWEETICFFIFTGAIDILRPSLISYVLQIITSRFFVITHCQCGICTIKIPVFNTTIVTLISIIIHFLFCKWKGYILVYFCKSCVFTIISCKKFLIKMWF